MDKKGVTIIFIEITPNMGVRMKSTAKKVNFMIENKVRKELELLVPPGQRSRIVNEALRKELDRMRKTQAIERLHRLRREGNQFSTQEIISILRKERMNH